MSPTCSRAQALKTAIWAIEEQIKKAAFDANLHEIYKVQNPTAVNAAKRKKKLEAALETIKAMQTAPELASVENSE